MTSQRSTDETKRKPEPRSNNANQTQHDTDDTNRFEADAREEPGASGDQTRNSVTDGNRGVGNNTDGVVGSGGSEGFGTRDNR